MKSKKRAKKWMVAHEKMIAKQISNVVFPSILSDNYDDLPFQRVKRFKETRHYPFSVIYKEDYEFKFLDYGIRVVHKDSWNFDMVFNGSQILLKYIEKYNILAIAHDVKPMIVFYRMRKKPIVFIRERDFVPSINNSLDVFQNIFRIYHNHESWIGILFNLYIAVVQPESLLKNGGLNGK